MATAKGQVGALEAWLSRLRPVMRTRLAIAANMGPFLGFLIVFFFVPLAILILYSFGVLNTPGETRPAGFDYYLTLTQPPHGTIILRSMWFAFLATLICLVIGYPVAYYIAIHAGKYRNFLVLLVLIPFWVTFIIRVYALFQIFHQNSPVYGFLVALGWRDGQPFLQSGPAVILGIVYTHVPFMILPLYANMVGFDVSLVEAAQSLGASRARTFLRVTLPLTMGGIVAGSLLVFIPGVGVLVESALLGGTAETMAGLWAWVQFIQRHNWEVASALSMFLISLTLVLVYVYIRVAGRKEPVGLL